MFIVVAIFEGSCCNAAGHRYCQVAWGLKVSLYKLCHWVWALGLLVIYSDFEV